MKYIMFEVSICDIGIKYLPFIFPNIMVHRQMAYTLLPHLRAIYNSVKVISAGEYNPATGLCYGNSETLNVKSRGLQDSDIIVAFNILHGTV